MLLVVFKKLKRVSLVGLVILSFQKASALECSALFNDVRVDQDLQIKALNELIAIESRVEKIERIKVEIQSALDIIRETINELVAGIDHNPAVFREIEKLSKKVEKIESQLAERIQRENVTNLQEAMSNLRLVRANFFYKVESQDPYLQRIIFSESVVHDVFHSQNALYDGRLGDQILKSLYRGRRFSTDTSGIIPFTNDKSVFKIKIAGTALGALRLAGYFVGQDFYVVSFMHESSHNKRTSHRLTDQVNSIRKTNGHER